MKRRIAAVLVMMLVCMSIIGCGNSKEPPNDEAFMKNLSAGLQARWKVTNSNKDTAERENAEEREYLTGLVDKELEKLGNYSDYVFTDSNLAELAQQYYDALQMQKEGIKKYGLDDEEYTTLFGGGYNTRAKLISKFYDNYNLAVKDDYNDDLEALVQDGYAVIKEEDKFEAIQNLVNEQVVLTALGGSDYELVYTNSTEYDLDNVELTIKFYSESGNEIGNITEYDTVSAGAQSTKKIYIYNIDEFATAKMSILYRTDDDYFTTKETEFRDITVANDKQFSFTAKNLSTEVSYVSSYSGIMTTVEITGISTKEAYWTDGKCTFSLVANGKKTYDQDGDQSTSPCECIFKVYDSTGKVVGSGSIFASSIMVGDDFSAESYVNDLDPGDYTVEFFDSTI